METKDSFAVDPAKVRTGIEGFDEITAGGLPRGRTTLIEGGPGSGKTVMALQTLANGALQDGEPGIFVAFEETSQRLVANAAKFGWDLAKLQKKKLFILDAQPTPDFYQAGAFDLSGMLAALEAKAREIGAVRIVFDALDVVLTLLNDPAAERRELYRLHEWLLERGFTAIITAKLHQNSEEGVRYPASSRMQFMVDCALLLNVEVVEGMSQRNLRVVKYRGSSFSENESPFLITPEGIEVAGGHEMKQKPTGTTLSAERLSSGVGRLDAMLGGGYFRNGAILITGFPGTAKSTLGGAFAEAACQRGERTLLISFDSDANEVVRNLESVNIRLGAFAKKGVLSLVSARAISGNAEIHLMQVKRMARAHKARCVIIDPVSALAKGGNGNTAYSVTERLVDWTKDQGITLFCTSLLDSVGDLELREPMVMSTIVDTWIHLSYLVHAGERNRGLSIVKSRGTSHSNQVRELVLSNAGVTLADAYTAGGEVLMGTLRWEKEQSQRVIREEEERSKRLKQATLRAEEALLEVKLKAVQLDLEAKQIEKEALTRLTVNRTEDQASGRTHLDELRGVDKNE